MVRAITACKSPSVSKSLVCSPDSGVGGKNKLLTIVPGFKAGAAPTDAMTPVSAEVYLYLYFGTSFVPRAGSGNDGHRGMVLSELSNRLAPTIYSKHSLSDYGQLGEKMLQRSM